MEYFARLYRFWFPCGLHGLLWLVLAIAPIFFFQTTIHEGLHSLASAMSGNGFAKFAPFPHFNSSFNYNLMGVTLSGGNGFNAMPQIGTILLIIGVALISIFVRIRSGSVRFLLHMLLIGMCVDLGYNTIKGLVGAAKPLSDWGKLTTDIGVTATTILAWLFWLIMISYFVWMYFSVWHNSADESKSWGFWDFRPVCLVLSIISVIAIPIFIGINFPNMDKGAFWLYTALLVLHFAVVIGGGIYFIFASVKRGRFD